MEYTCLAADLALWEGRPDDARRAVQVGLRSASLRDVAPHRTRLAALGLRAEAERAELAEARREPTAEARRSADELLAVARDAPDLAEAAAWRAVAEAEHTRVEGRSEPERWRTAVEAWDASGRPYPAAYCRWRLSEALLASGVHPAEAAVPAREAFRVASWLGASPLQRELELLAQRARLDLV